MKQQRDARRDRERERQAQALLSLSAECLSTASSSIEKDRAQNEQPPFPDRPAARAWQA
jgi:hypothetical protein